MTEPVLTEMADGVGVLTLDRPQAKNAVDRHHRGAGRGAGGVPEEEPERPTPH
jgi:hypothetical protein